MTEGSLREMRLTAVTPVADDTTLFAFRALDGQELPGIEPGAHIDLHLPTGIVRQYSLVIDEEDRRQYVVAIKKDRKSRGGSRLIHEEIGVGSVLSLSPSYDPAPTACAVKARQLNDATSRGFADPLVARTGLLAVEAMGDGRLGPMTRRAAVCVSDRSGCPCVDSYQGVSPLASKNRPETAALPSSAYSTGSLAPSSGVMNPLCPVRSVFT